MDVPDRQQLLRGAVEDILEPLARLCVAQGLPFADAEELFKTAYVRAAREARRDAGAPAARDVSQVSIATGINRREVARITAELQPRAVQRPAPVSRLFMRWVSDPRLRGRDGRPRELPRVGKAPSFEALAGSITRHVHPRSLLDELCRLGLAELVDEGRTVRLLTDGFTPHKDDARLFRFLGANVGDHLAAATANVVHRDRRHHEQAVFTDELSAASAEQVSALARAQWSRVIEALVPELERLIDEDKQQGRTPTHRARVGMFSYHEALKENTDDPSSEPDASR